ncbi:MAG TPA: fibronectin type III domain-containing protein, partial [Verrucomicrobiae bacterium]|nr:fibronectin type III domain-containing protein [Verrucomicrobiae bacterium]
GDNTTAAYGASNDTWLKLTRVGDLFTGYNSADGVTWTQISSATISMTGPVYISLVANSGNTTDGQTVAFDNVTLTGTTPQGPATPTNLAVTFNDSSDALFSWDAAPSGDSLSGYNLYMSTDGGTTFSLADTLTDPTATSDEITGLTPNTPYTFQLKASDNNDNESDPATASATSPDGILAPVISSITPGSLTPYGTGSVTITWSSNTASGIDKAYVELREPGDSNWFTDYEIPNPNSDTSATLSDLYVGAIYQARIRFVTDDASAYSAAQSITTAGYSGDTSLDQITAVPSPTPDPNHPDIVPVGMNIDWTSTVDNPPDHYLITQDSNNPLFPDRWYMSTDHSSGGALLGSLSYGGFDAQSGSGLITNSSDWSLAAGFSGSRPTDGTTPIITSATTDGNGNITLQWSGNSTGYYVVNLTTDLIDNVTGNSVTFTDNDNLGTGGHSMNRFGYYAVVGYQNISSGQLFTPMSNLVDLSKANTPKWAQAGNYTANSLTLFWDNTSYNETGYQIYRLNTTTGLYDLKATVKPDVTQWTDTDVALDGRYTYQIQATRANTTLNSQPTTVAATMPSVTIDSITASMNGDSQSTSKARDDTSLTIDDGDTISAVYNTSQTLDFKANNLSPNTVAAKNLIKWTVQPDPAKANPLPTFTPDATDPLQAHMMLDKAGSFNVIVYVDKNSNGNFDPGEQLRVLHLVIATLTIDPTQITSLTPPNAYTATLNANTVQFQEANSNTHAYNVTVANVLLTAGGANSRVGIFEASQNRLPGAQKVNPGWIQNGTGDTAQMAYGQAGTGNDGLVAGTTFPLLDAFGQNPGTGGVTAMEPGGASNWGRPPTGGMSLTEKDIDTPTVSFDQQHTFVQNNGPVQATQLSGSFTFTDSLSLVSTDFPTTYSAYLQIQWNVTFNFVWDGKAWVDKGTVAAILKTTPMPNGGSPGATAAPVWTAKETKTYQ